MRYLSLSIFLSILSFNLSATKKRKEFTFEDLPEEPFSRILNIATYMHEPRKSISKISKVNRRWKREVESIVENDIYLQLLSKAEDGDWIQKAIEATKNKEEPKHLLDMVEFESILFDQFLKEKESNFTTSKEWREHALLTLLTFSTFRGRTIRITSEICWRTADVADHSVIDLSYDAHFMQSLDIIYGGMIKIAGREAVRIADSVGNSSVGPAMCKAQISDGNMSKDLGEKNACVMNKPGENSRFVTPYCITYRVSETQKWITALNPEFQIFKHNYDACKLSMIEIPQENLDKWFKSKEDYNNKINKYFVEEERINDDLGKFLKPLVNHLKRIGKKIFPEDSLVVEAG